MKTKRRTATTLALVALAALVAPKMQAPAQQTANTPKLLNDQEAREMTKRIKQEVQRSAARLKAEDERTEAIRRENPNLPKPPDSGAGELPRRFTWEDHGGVTAVQDQSPAGTCWSFARVGALEAEYLIRYGTAFNLAEQDLIDCNRDPGAFERELRGIGFDTQNPYQKSSDPHGPARRTTPRLPSRA